jgi:ligand-binding sensor domain-containing protein
MVHSIIQDSKGKMWFATNGGVYIYDGTTRNIAEKRRASI